VKFLNIYTYKYIFCPQNHNHQLTLHSTHQSHEDTLNHMQYEI